MQVQIERNRAPHIWVNRLVIAGATITLLIVAFQVARNIFYYSRMFHTLESHVAANGYRLYTDGPAYMNYNDSVVISAYITRQPHGSTTSRAYIIKADSCDASAPAFDLEPVNQSDSGKCQWVALAKYVGSQVIAIRITYRNVVMRSYREITVADNPLSLTHLASIAALATALVALYFRFLGKPADKIEP